MEHWRRTSVQCRLWLKCKFFFLLSIEMISLFHMPFSNLFNNNFTGTLPTEMGKLTALTELYLHNNRWNGTIPSQFGRLVNLKKLYLSSSKLTGAIPEQFGALLRLEELDLHSANLTGSLSDIFKRFVKLSSLYVDKENVIWPTHICCSQVVVWQFVDWKHSDFDDNVVELVRCQFDNVGFFQIDIPQRITT